MKFRLMLFFLTTAFALALAPQLLRLERVEYAVIERLRQELPRESDLDTIRWHWWPLPYVSLNNLHLRVENWQMTAPEAEFHPFRRPIGRKGSAGLIVLRQPYFHLETSATEKKDPAPASRPRLPQLSLFVQDGTLSVADGILSPAFKPGSLQISGIQGQLSFSGEDLTIQASGSTSFARELSVKGIYRPMTDSYRLTLETRGFMLHHALSSIAGSPVGPGESVVDLTSDIQGRGFADFRADVKGRLPCLLVRPEDHQMLITCGHADFSLIRSGSSLELAIHDLRVQEPSLRLEGRIGYRGQGQETAPIWDIDLTAHDLEVARLRDKVLLLSSHRVPEGIADVLRAGRASTLNLQFAGTSAELAQIERYSISGRIEDAEIMVPKVDLHLTGVTGQFSIQQGNLNGSGLKAQLGNSTGWNGSLLVALRKPWSVGLDLDLDANLAELPDVLHKTVLREDFLREVDRFSSMEGRASGNLHLRYSPGSPVVRVKVNNFAVKGRYEHLAWPFAASGGQMDIISNRQVSWQTIKANVGPHRITETTGMVSWPEILHLDIQSMDARVAAGPLFRELATHLRIREKLFQALTNIDGTFKVSGATLRGPLFLPEQWRYQLNAATKDITWTSPLLSETVLTRQAAFRISDEEIEVLASDNLIVDQPLLLQGGFRHQRLGQWHGWVKLNGTVDGRLAGWVKSRGWIPEMIYPRVPFTMHELRIAWQGNHFAFDGAVAGGGPGKSTHRTDFRISHTGEDLFVPHLMITSAEEQALLSLHLQQAEAPRLDLEWQGVLEGSTLEALFENNRFLTGRLGGTWSLRYVPGDPQQTRLVGEILASQVRLPAAWPELPTIEQLQAKGEDGRLDISLLRLSTGKQEALGRGRMEIGSEGLELDLQLQSPLLSWPALSRLQTAIRTSSGEGEEKSWKWQPSWDLLGNIDFEIEEFIYPGLRGKHSLQGSNQGKDSGYVYRWQPLRGSISLQSGKSWSLDLDHGDICGLIMTGSWHSDDTGEGRLRLRSNPDSLPRFDRVMPCLGIDQDLLIGSFNLEVILVGSPGKWTGGKASLRSEQGTIRRLRFLSRVFKVVNLTDLFKGPGEYESGGIGLPYSEMVLEAGVSNNQLVFEKAMVRGEGLNLFGRGRFDLGTYRSDLTILIAPFKTIDLIVSKVPIIGRAVGGRNASVVTIPVGVKGPISDPAVMVLSPESVGEGIFLMVWDFITLPFSILGPTSSGTPQQPVAENGKIEPPAEEPGERLSETGGRQDGGSRLDRVSAPDEENESEPEDNAPEQAPGAVQPLIENLI